eukprot:COSAG01_NODE_51437_length_354_cov_78.380392_1_plen_110_part_01
MFSRRFRGSCRNPDEVHGTLMARRQFPIHFSVGTDPDKKSATLPRDRPTSKDKGLYGCCSTRSMHGKLRLPAIHVSSRAIRGGLKKSQQSKSPYRRATVIYRSDNDATAT